MSLAEGKVGLTDLSLGSMRELALSKKGALITVDWIIELVLAGAVFNACNQAGSAVTNLNTTATGFILTNPPGSGKNVILLEVQFIQTSTAAAAAHAGLVLAANNNVQQSVSHTTPLIPRCMLLGSGNTSLSFADSAATLPGVPVVIRPLWQPSVSATATTGIPPVIRDKVNGAVILKPGAAISMSAFSALSGITSMTWAEVNE